MHRQEYDHCGNHSGPSSLRSFAPVRRADPGTRRRHLRRSEYLRRRDQTGSGHETTVCRAEFRYQRLGVTGREIVESARVKLQGRARSRWPRGEKPVQVAAKAVDGVAANRAARCASASPVCPGTGAPPRSGRQNGGGLRVAVTRCPLRTGESGGSKPVRKLPYRETCVSSTK